MAQAKPAEYNIFIRKEADWEFNLTYRDESKNPIDVTGYSAWLTIREDYEQPVEKQLTVGSGITLGGAAGTIDCALSDTETAALKIEKGVYDLLLDDGSGQRFVLVEGVVTVGRAVTRGAT